MNSKYLEKLIQEEYEKIVQEQLLAPMNPKASAALYPKVIPGGANAKNWRRYWTTDNKVAMPKVVEAREILESLGAKWASDDPGLARYGALILTLNKGFVDYIGTQVDNTKGYFANLAVGTQLYFEPNGKVSSKFTISRNPEPKGDKGDVNLHYAVEGNPAELAINLNANQAEGGHVGYVRKIANGDIALVKTKKPIPIGTQVLNWIQLIADWAGLWPGYGDIIDAVNAFVYAVRGRFIEAAFSAIAIIPAIGSVIKLGPGSAIRIALQRGAWAKKVLPKVFQGQAGAAKQFWKLFANDVEIQKALLDGLKAGSKISGKNITTISGVSATTFKSATQDQRDLLAFYKFVNKNAKGGDIILDKAAKKFQESDYLPVSVVKLADKYFKIIRTFFVETSAATTEIATKMEGVFKTNNIFSSAGRGLRMPLAFAEDTISSGPFKKWLAGGITGGQYLKDVAGSISNSALALRTGALIYTKGSSEIAIAAKALFGNIFRGPNWVRITKEYMDLVAKRIASEPKFISTVFASLPAKTIQDVLGGGNKKNLTNLLQDYLERELKRNPADAAAIAKRAVGEMDTNIKPLQKYILDPKFFQSRTVKQAISNINKSASDNVLEKLILDLGKSGNPVVQMFFNNKAWQFDKLFKQRGDAFKEIAEQQGFKKAVTTWLKEDYFKIFKRNIKWGDRTPIIGRKTADQWYGEFEDLRARVGLSGTDMDNPDAAIVPLIFAMINIGEDSGTAEIQMQQFVSGDFRRNYDAYSEEIADYLSFIPEPIGNTVANMIMDRFTIQMRDMGLNSRITLPNFIILEDVIDSIMNEALKDAIKSGIYPKGVDPKSVTGKYQVAKKYVIKNIYEKMDPEQKKKYGYQIRELIYELDQLDRREGDDVEKYNTRTDTDLYKRLSVPTSRDATANPVQLPPGFNPNLPND